MISIGRLHVLTLTATPIIATLAVVSGSELLATTGGLLVAALLYGSLSLHDIARSKTRTVVVHAVTVAVLVAVLAQLRTLQIDAVLVVAMLGIFNRFMLRGGHRDDFLVVGASSVLLAAATTITPGVTFFFLLLAYVPTLLWALWTAMMLGTAEDDVADPAKKVAAIRSVAVRVVPGQARFIATAGLALMAAGYAAVSVLPRYSFAAAIFGAGRFMPLPGASNSMELTAGGAETFGDSTVVLRVEPAPGTPRSSLTGLYARLWVLDQLDGRTFKTSSDSALFPLGAPMDRAPEGESETELEADDPPGTVRVVMNRLVRDHGQHPLATLGTDAPSEVMRRHARQSVSGTWISPPFRGTALTYKVRIGRTFKPKQLPRHVLERQGDVLAFVPEDLDPRILELGRRLAEGKTTTDEKVLAVLQHLSRGFTYSLEPLAGRSADPLARFLFEAKQGHCELYAGAAAVLLRVAGVKARVATGYYNGSWNELGGYLQFTQEDAHAWVEVLDDAGAWRWIDATPEDLRSVRNRPLLSFLRDWYDAAEAFWFDNVVDFDEAKRRQLVERVAKRVEGLASAVGGLFDGDGGGTSAAGSRTGAALVTGAAALAVLVGLSALVIRRRRREVAPEVIGVALRRALGARPDENATLGVIVARLPDALRDE
ncbi:DUF3488 and transglutaminase-like domain-containing protein, partial [Myxococcota bacterium]|nr:DUF3488 and transglutaminase-like domain-containing protein [Myxococcota bacterium]